MNISHDGSTVRFKTEPEELFLAEKSGVKSNTVRILDLDEWKRINSSPPKKIVIQNQQEVFLRTLTHIYRAGVFLGKVIVIFSWANEKHHHTLSNTSYAHTMSLDQLDPFENALHGHHSLSFEHGDHNLGLQQEAESPIETCQSVEESSIGERFAAIAISKGTLAILQSVAHGHTIDYIIRKLHDAYLDKKAEERGPLHD